MKGRRIIALLLAHLYLLTVAAQTVCVLNCPCIGEDHHHADDRTCICYGQPGHQHLEEHDGCGHNHDTQIDLYTFSNSDCRESSRMTVPVLAAQLPAEAFRIGPADNRPLRITTPPEHCHCAVYLSLSALRAPPALA